MRENQRRGAERKNEGEGGEGDEKSVADHTSDLETFRGMRKRTCSSILDGCSTNSTQLAIPLSPQIPSTLGISQLSKLV
jgi:hypothetical protein